MEAHVIGAPRAINQQFLDQFGKVILVHCCETDVQDVNCEKFHIRTTDEAGTPCTIGAFKPGKLLQELQGQISKNPQTTYVVPKLVPSKSQCRSEGLFEAVLQPAMWELLSPYKNVVLAWA